MAKVIEVEINLGDRQALKTLQDLEQAQEQLLEQLKQTEIGTQEYSRLQKQLKNVGNQVKDLELGFESLDKEQRATALVDSFTGVAGAVTAATGALTLLGVESEDLGEVEKRILGLIAVTSGLRDVSNGLVAANKLIGPSFTELASTIKTAFLESTLSAKAFQVALAGTGIGLAIIAFEALSTAAEENAKREEELTKIIEEQTAAREQQRSFIDKELGDLQALLPLLESDTLSREQRNQAIRAIQKEYPDYLKNQDLDKIKTEDIAAANTTLTENLIKRAQAAAAVSKLTEISTRELEAEAAAVKLLNLEEQLRIENIQNNRTPQEQRLARQQSGIDALIEQNEKTKEQIKTDKEALLLLIEQNDLLPDIVQTTTASTKATEKNTTAKKANVKVTKEQVDLERGRREALAEDAEAIEERYAQSELDLLEQLEAGLITQQEFDDLTLRNETLKLEELIKLQEFYGIASTDLQKKLIEARMKLYKQDETEVVKTEEAKQVSIEETLRTAQSAIGNLSGLFKEGSDAAKAAALTEIAVNTALGFVQGLDIAQKGAKATGPLAPFAFPIFYATQIASVIGAVNKAKQVLGGGGPTATPPSTGGAPSVPGGSTGAPGGLFDTETDFTTTSTGGPGAIKTYVLAGDVANGLEANNQIKRRRKL